MSTIVSTSAVTGASSSTYVTASGSSTLDTAALISAAVVAKMQAAYRIDSEVATLKDKVSAYEEMQSDLQAIIDAADDLTSNSDTSVFSTLEAYLSSSAISDPTDVLGVTVGSDAELGIYQVVVSQIAMAEKIVGNEQTSSTTALGKEGTFTLQLAGHTQVSIDVTSGMSLSDVVKAVNNQSASSGVTATLVKTSDSGYTVMLAGSDTGKSITLADSSGTVLSDLGFLDGDAIAQAAQNAILTIDGQTVTSSSNDIENVLSGVSLSLYADTAGKTITLEVGQNLSGIESGITTLIDAYNTYRKFAVLNQTTDDNGAVDGAYLFGDNVLRNANAEISDALRKSVTVDGTTYRLADLGITYDESNYLEVDTDTLNDFLTQHPDVVEALFSQSATAANTDVLVTGTAGSMDSGTYTVNLSFTGGAVSGATITDSLGKTTDLTIVDGIIKGADGTDYEGLRLIYTGTTTESSLSTTLTVKGGLADAVTRSLDGYANTSDGLIQKRIDSIDDTITDQEDKRDLIASNASDYEAYLVKYYAKIEAAMEKSASALALVKALFKLNNSSSS